MIIITVATQQIQQTIANGENVLASLKSFALETEVVDHLQARLQYIQEEEPQYENN